MRAGRWSIDDPVGRARRVAPAPVCRLGWLTLTVGTLLAVPGCVGAAGTREGVKSSTDKGRTSSARSASTAVRQDPQEVRLVVNSETLTADQLVKNAYDDFAGKAWSMSADAFRTHVERRAAELITDKIAEMLLFQRAKMKLPDDSDKKIDGYVDAEIRRIVTTRFEGVQHRYEKELASRGLDLDDARARIRREVIIAGFLEEEIKPKVGEPSRAELVSAYETEGTSLARPERRQMSVIEFRADAEGAADAAPALARIQAAQEELRSGAAFPDVARKYSDGTRALDGGAWGWVTRGSVREKYEAAVEALYRLNEGEVSDIIRSGDSLFLVRCDAVDRGVAADFLSVQPQLRERLIRDKYNRTIVDLVNQLRSNARVEPANLDLFHAEVVKRAIAVHAAPKP